MANLFGSTGSSSSLRAGQRVARTFAGRLTRPDVAKLGFETFDLQPRDRAVGERQEHHARRRLGLLERHGQQVQPVVGPLVREARVAKRRARDRSAATRSDPLLRPGLRAAPSRSACR